MSELDVPVIDISGFSSGDAGDRAAVVTQVDDAARDVGFMQIVGHRIPDQVIDGLTSAMDGFFALPMESKKSWRPSLPSVNRGYTAPKTERLSHSLGVYSPDDLFEAFNVGTQADDFPDVALPVEHYPSNLWPTSPAGFRHQVATWFGHAGGLARTMTSIFATALGLPADHFDAFTDHSVDVLRMNNYQIPGGDARLDPGQLGMGPHTDFGIVTILWADPLPGLQILHGTGAAGSWHDVVPAPGALLINLGDLLARWTNDRWRSTLHRVLAPVDAGGQVFRRRSAAFFHDGNADAVIATLPGCAGEGDPYPPITVADHIAAKLGGSRGLTLNAAGAREASRLAVAAG